MHTVRGVVLAAGGVSSSCCLPRAKAAPLRATPKPRGVVVRASGQQAPPDGGPETDAETDAEGAQRLAGDEDKSFSMSIDGVNPVNLGRRSRAFIDDVWQKVLGLGNVVRTNRDTDGSIIIGGPLCDFESPQASYTTVLVIGATGRIGRIVVRKLLLRGYTVRALVRGSSPEALDGIPKSVTVIRGDVGDFERVREAAEGANKVIICGRARTTETLDIENFERNGVRNITKALLDMSNARAIKRAGRSAKNKIAVLRFKDDSSLEDFDWKAEDLAASRTAAPGGMADIVRKLGVKSSVSCAVERPSPKSSANLVFSGTVYSKGEAQVSGSLNALPAGASIAAGEGFHVRAQGDGKRYGFMAATEGEGGELQWYSCNFVARPAWHVTRIPFSSFRPVDPMGAPLDPGRIRRLGFRYEVRGQPRRPAAEGAADENGQFRLDVSFVKVLPGGDEPDLILVSCAGAGLGAEEADKVVPAKRLSEQIVKNSGLGYTIIRPGTLFEEPGGARALVFDQGGRITQGISCADVADVALKSLHDAEARNKAFDVCYEYTPEDSMYELVAHLPDKSNNYLTPALLTLEKNT